MEALQAGSPAPDFSLPLIDGTDFSLSAALRRGPVLFVFFKASCPVCQYAMPYLERLYQAHLRQHITLVGVSQNSRRDTEVFERTYDFTFPVALDHPGYRVSNAYGLTTVPTFFYIAPNGVIEVSSAGWVKAEFEEINRKLSSAHKVAAPALFQPDEQVAVWRAG